MPTKFNNLKTRLKTIKSKFKIPSFTLVELIVVVIILVVLAVIAVMTVTSWIGKSRDSRRKSDIVALNNGLNLYIAEHTIFPDPDNYFLVKDATGAIAWYQGVFGSGVKEFLQGLKKEPKDPVGTYYGYSITADKKKYQIKATLEKGESFSVLGDRLYAATPKYAHMKGPYDGWLITHTGAGASEYYMLWQVPSLFIDESKLVDGFRLTGGNLPVLQEGKETTTNFPVKLLTVTPLFDSDTSNDGIVLSSISSTFSGYDSNSITGDTVKQIVRTAPGATATVASALAPSGDGSSSSTSSVSPTPPTMGDVPDQYLTKSVAMDQLLLSGYVTKTNGDAITGYQLSGTLLTGLTFNSLSGIITGTPTLTGNFSMKARAGDKDGRSTRDSFVINVGICGDAIVQDGEQCDFGVGNQISNKCTNTCQVQPTCPATPGDCPVCTFGRTTFDKCVFGS